jgi:uncharacterized protein YydD (DUF2326 family)
MFLHKLASNDERFKTLSFHDGLNLIVAERTESSRQGDSRNGTGKSSFVRLLRYAFGGSLASELSSPYLADHSFELFLSVASAEGKEEFFSGSRRVSPTTRVVVEGWSATEGRTDLHVDEWRVLLGQELFHLPSEVSRPTPGQLWGQLVRTYFGRPTKGHGSEADWETGVKLGYFLGLSPEVLERAGDVDRLSKQRKAIRAAVREGAIRHLSADEADLRSQLATARRRRDRVQVSLRDFKVDQQYAEHQVEADDLSARIKRHNEEALSIERRIRELTSALASEVDAAADEELRTRVVRVYGELGLELPGTVLQRFEDVADFHESVVRNRRVFLQSELDALRQQLDVIAERRVRLDDRRAEVLRLLSNSVALDTFLEAQRSLSELDATAADLERRLESAIEINEIDTRLKVATAENEAAVRAEVAERSNFLDRPISHFNELGREIYTDREADLLIHASRGLLQVQPRVSGDASEGIRSVETYLLDMVCLIAALEAGRAPRLLVHDSHLFDAMDHRQVASCLNIGARLAEEHGFQYIVTMNSDFLASVESQGAFRGSDYAIETKLTDSGEAGGLFGFRFE